MNMINTSELFWNIWGHRHPELLHDYLVSGTNSADICLLTEVTDVPIPCAGPLTVHTSRDATEPPTQVNGRQ